ncbi:MAG: TetR family transcriptional regulator [Bacteroidota bacterium]
MKVQSEEIFDKVIQFAEEEGWSNLTVRSISKQIGYSTIKIYSDYGSKENLLFEIQQGGFRKIRKYYLDAARQGTDKVQQLLEISCAHVHFSFNNKALYDLMFSLNGANCNANILTEKRKVAQELRAFIDPLHQQDKHTVFMQYYALISGLAIVVREMKGIDEKKLTHFVKSAIQNFIKGIQ